MKQNRKRGLYLYNKKIAVRQSMFQPRISEPVGECNAGNMRSVYYQCLWVLDLYI